MLYVPTGGFNFRAIQSNVAGVRPLNTVGAVLTPAVGSKGAWAEVFASLDNDTYGLMIQIHNAATSAANRTYAIDIGIGASGSELVIIPDLIGSCAATMDARGGHWYYFPFYIPAGTRVAARAQGSVTTSVRVNVQAMQRPAAPWMHRTCGKVEEIGLSGIVGTSVTASGSNSEGSWTLIGTTTQDNWWWQFGAQIAVADTTHNTGMTYFDIARGDGTNFQVIVENINFKTSTSEDMGKPLSLFGCECFVPSGSSIYVRGWTSGAGDPFEVAVYGAG